jgi:hypothetical protein
MTTCSVVDFSDADLVWGFPPDTFGVPCSKLNTHCIFFFGILVDISLTVHSRAILKIVKSMCNGIIVIYTISGIKAILQDSSVKIADDEGVSPSSSVITRVFCNML